MLLSIECLYCAPSDEPSHRSPFSSMPTLSAPATMFPSSTTESAKCTSMAPQYSLSNDASFVMNVDAQKLVVTKFPWIIFESPKIKKNLTILRFNILYNFQNRSDQTLNRHGDIDRIVNHIVSDRNRRRSEYTNSSAKTIMKSRVSHITGPNIIISQEIVVEYAEFRVIGRISAKLTRMNKLGI